MKWRTWPGASRHRAIADRPGHERLRSCGTAGQRAHPQDRDDNVKIAYVAGTTVPENWIPFIPVHAEGSVSEFVCSARAWLAASRRAVGSCARPGHPTSWKKKKFRARASTSSGRGSARAGSVAARSSGWAGGRPPAAAKARATSCSIGSGIWRRAKPERPRGETPTYVQETSSRFEACASSFPMSPPSACVDWLREATKRCMIPSSAPGRGTQARRCPLWRAQPAAKNSGPSDQQRERVGLARGGVR